MTPGAWGALIGAGAWLLFRLDERPGLAPDSRYYVDLANGKRVPSPFCYRGLWPLVLGWLGQSAWGWQIVVCISLIAQGAFLADLAGTPLAALLLMGLPGGARFSVRYPLLVDAPTMALVLLYAAQHQVGPWPIWWAIGVGFSVSLTRENAALWVAILTGEWWVMVGFLPALALGWLSNHRPASAAGGDSRWITAPLGTSLAARRGMWFSPGLMLLPWGVVLPLAVWASPSWGLAGILALAYLPLAGVSDAARVYQWAAPSLILLALQAPVPEGAWPFLLVAHWFNPYRGA